MKAGTENRRKTIIAGVLLTLGVLGVGYELFGGNSAPPVIKPPVITQDPHSSQSVAPGGSPGTVTGSNAMAALGTAPGVPAAKLTSASSSLDPTLDQVAMLRTESLEYSGAGRNIFSATYVAPVVVNKSVAPVKVKTGPPAPPVYTPPQGPPLPPPINLKFFGTEKHADGRLQGFFLNGDDVYLANPGDIVARKYKIQSIDAMSARVEDLQNNNVQTLPRQMQ
jgi:hypothetical protein